jgi:hypothetical protein
MCPKNKMTRRFLASASDPRALQGCIFRANTGFLP